MDKPEQVLWRLLQVAGTTHVATAGIRMNDKPIRVFQLLVLCMLASKPIDAQPPCAPRANARLAAAFVRMSLDDDVREWMAG
jgi:hypothetical protein